MPKPKKPKINIGRFIGVVRRKTPHPTTNEKHNMERMRMAHKTALLQQPFFWKLNKAKRQELMRFLMRFAEGASKAMFSAQYLEKLKKIEYKNALVDRVVEQILSSPSTFGSHIAEYELIEFAKKNKILKKIDRVMRKAENLLDKVEK